MPGIRSARLIWVACAALLALASSPAGATSRIKDLANIEGVRQNQLIGYGLVVGLNGTGDTLNNIPFTKQSLQAMLERMGVNIRGATIRTGNVAAVMVTGNLPAFGTQGTRMDVTVSARILFLLASICIKKPNKVGHNTSICVSRRFSLHHPVSRYN